MQRRLRVGLKSHTCKSARGGSRTTRSEIFFRLQSGLPEISIQIYKTWRQTASCTSEHLCVRNIRHRTRVPNECNNSTFNHNISLFTIICRVSKKNFSRLNNQFVHGKIIRFEDVKKILEPGRNGFPLTRKTFSGFEDNEEYNWRVPIKKQKYKLLAKEKRIICIFLH